MTDDDLRRVFDELHELRSLMERMLETHAAAPQARKPEPARADDLVDADYFASVTGLSRVTILQGKAGTSAVPLAGRRPKRWYRRDVDAFQRGRVAGLRPPRAKALRLLDRGGVRKRSVA